MLLPPASIDAYSQRLNFALLQGINGCLPFRCLHKLTKPEIPIFVILKIIHVTTPARSDLIIDQL